MSVEDQITEELVAEAVDARVDGRDEQADWLQIYCAVLNGPKEKFGNTYEALIYHTDEAFDAYKQRWTPTTEQEKNESDSA